MSRNIIIIISVVVFHVAALWALQTGLLRRAIELIVPAEVLVEFIEPPSPQVAIAPPAPASPVKRMARKAPTPAKITAPQPVAVTDSTPPPNNPTSIVVPASPSLAATAPALPTAPVRVELPSSDARYLQNPTPPYPSISRRLGEQGKVMVHVLIGLDGLAQKAEIKQSSGFDRLDQSALATVLRWRYVPGKRAGMPEAMWFNVPINFVLE